MHLVIVRGRTIATWLNWHRRVMAHRDFCRVRHKPLVATCVIYNSTLRLATSISIKQ